MAKLSLHITGELPSDAMDQAAVLTALKGPRDTFVQALHTAGFKHEATLKITKDRVPGSGRSRKTAA